MTENIDTLIKFWKSVKENNCQKYIDELSSISFVPFIGSGMSVPFGFPDWSDFLSNIIDQFCEGDKKQEYIEKLKKAEFLSLADDLNGDITQGLVEEQVRNRFSKTYLKNVEEDKNYLSLMKKASIKTFVTTNFDPVIETCMNFSTAEVYLPSNMLNAGNVINDIKSGKPYTIKLHGSADIADSIIITGKAFHDMYKSRNKALKEVIDFLWNASVLLFIGCGLNSDYLIEHLQKIAGSTKTNWHYAILPYPKSQNLIRRRKELAKLKIRPIWYEDGKYQQINIILKAILGLNKENGGIDSIDEKSITDIICKVAKEMNKQSYTEGRFIDFNTALNDAISFIDMPKICNRIKGDDDNCPLKLIDLLNSDNTTNGFLLVGKGGCGKTFMLLDIVKKFSEGKFNKAIPIYIALNKFNEAKYNDIILSHLIATVKNFKNDIDSTVIKTWLKQDWTRCVNDYPLLLLDGFNEITTDEVIDKIVIEIRKLQLEYPRIRFVITCRYDISMRFTIGSSARIPFKGKNVQPLSKEYVEKYVKKNLGNAYCDGEITNKIYDVIQRPMALIMYIKSRKHENEGYELIHHYPQNLGEILDNYVTIILNLNVDKTNEREKLNLFYFIGYCMNYKGCFEITKRQLSKYLNEGAKYFNTNEIKIEDFLKLPMVKDVLYVPNGNSQTIHFYHQDFRDYFCAKFLEYILTYFDREKITSIFKIKLPNDILVLLSEILGEYKFRPQSNYDCDDKDFSIIQDTLQSCYKGIFTQEDTVAIAQLIDVVRCGRQNSLGGFDFSGLDLSNTSLNNCKLYYMNNGSPHAALFNGTYLSDYTFLPAGHAAAIYTMCSINNRFIISFSIESMRCYDRAKRIQYKIADIKQNTPITASACIEEHNIIITGDKKGVITIWPYEINDKIVIFNNIKNFFVESNVRGMKIAEIAGKKVCLFTTEDGRAFYYIPENKKIHCFFQYNETKNIVYTQYMGELISVTTNEVYFAFGKDVFCINLSQIGEKELTSFDIEPYYTWYDKDISFIYDIVAMKVYRKTVLLLNGHPYRNTNAKYKILEVINGTSEKVVLEKTIDAGRNDKGFRGFSKFAYGFSGNEVFLGANCISNRTPNLYRFHFNYDLIPDITPIMGIQAITIEGAFPIYNENNEKAIITCSADRSIQILCLDERRESVESHLPGHYNGVHSLDIIDDGKDSTIICVGQYSGALSVWRKQDGTWLSTQTCLLHKDWLWDVKHYICENSIYLFTCSYDHTVSVINVKTEEIICTLKRDDKIVALDILSDGRLVIAYNNNIELIEILYDKKCYRTLCKSYPSENTSCRALANITDGFLIATFVQNSSNSIIYKASIMENNKIKYTEIPPFNETILRSISVINYKGIEVIAYGGLSCGKNSEDCIIVCCEKKRKSYIIKPDVPSTVGISSVSFFYYKERIFLAASSYTSYAYILVVDTDLELKITPICRLKCDNQLLDVKIKDEKIYIASLSGNVFECSLGDILKFCVEGKGSEKSCFDAPTIDVSNKVIFHTVAGFAMNNVDFSQSKKAWNKDTYRLIEQYAITD